MKETLFRFVAVLLLGLSALRAGEALPPIRTTELAERVLAKGLAEIDLGLYPGTLLLQGMSELALVGPDRAMLARTVALYRQFAAKEIKGRGSFISYEVGGSGAAYLIYKDVAGELAAQVTDGAARMVAQQIRSSEGLLVPMWSPPEKDQVFIDIAFAVTPYLLYAGLAEDRSDYIDLAVFETLELFRILRDTRTGLVRQGRGFQSKAAVSDDNWSRGNGWGAVGLAALVRDLPATHPKRKEVEALAKDFFAAVLRHQNKDGLWHQEMTDVTSYTETSGSGLLLYGLGVMLEKGLLDRGHEAAFLKGLGALTAYIAADGSVSHACIGCLCPGQGTKEDYKSRVWAHNDSHAFGAVVLAYAQAAKMGIRSVTPMLKPGCFALAEDSPGKPRTYVRYNPDGGQNVAWENDRIAFRVYGPAVRNRVGSGIDVWAKSVEFPIIDKWYRLTAAGLEYHVERGEGCDFYDVGNLRGCGGSAVWRNGRPFPAQTYATQRIVRNEADEIEFTLTFEPWEADGLRVSEETVVRMLPGTNFFQVGSTIKTAGDVELTVGIGLSTFGHPRVTKDEAQGRLACWEKIKPDHGALGTAVVVEPGSCAGFGQTAKEEFILVKVKSNQPYTYFVGAGWEGNRRFKAPGSWEDCLRQEAAWAALAARYTRKAANR
jgi:rhamnogalacturonyl hydrolase YesR